MVVNLHRACFARAPPVQMPGSEHTVNCPVHPMPFVAHMTFVWQILWTLRLTMSQALAVGACSRPFGILGIRHKTWLAGPHYVFPTGSCHLVQTNRHPYVATAASSLPTAKAAGNVGGNGLRDLSEM